MASLVADIFQGGLRGRMARESLARATVATMFVTAGFSLLRGDSMEEIGERFDPRSRRFMLWNVGDVWVGPGGKILSFLRLAGTMARNRAQNPEDVIAYTADPALGFVRGNLSPAAGLFDVLARRRSFTGEPLFESPASFAEEAVGLTTPFWLHSAIFEGGSLRDRTVRAASELFGLRGFQMTPTWRHQLYAEEDYRTNRELNPDGESKRWSDFEITEKKHYQIPPYLTSYRIHWIF